MLLNGVATGQGEPLVLLHPIGLDATFWEGLEGLLDGFRVLRLDLRGHGQSRVSGHRPAIAVYADDVAETMSDHGMEQAAVLGVSFGGMVAQTLALSHPGHVSRLILCACPPGIGEPAREAIRERGLAAERDGMASIVPTTLERWFNPAFQDSPVVAQVRERLLTNDVQGWSDGWNAIAGFDARPRLNEIRARTLVVAGENDKATPREASEAIASGIAGATMTVIPGAPHMLQLETAAAFARIVQDFLGQGAQAGKGGGLE
ncbi:MAG: alpha/beta hydrolase [Rhizobiaceae bacterium]|nr:alpha/beta hydrolase [Rhizobiaceae bacterium]